MSPSVSDVHTVLQTFHWGELTQERPSSADTLFVCTGRRIYTLGDIDGQFRPRSNPYDVYALGHPDPEDPLANKLQGVWAQPVKGMNRYGYQLTVDDEPWPLQSAVQFTQRLDGVCFDYRREDLSVERFDFAAMDQPVMFTSLTLTNTGARTLQIELAFQVEFDLVDAWFTHLGAARNTAQRVTAEEDCLAARAAAAPQQWGAAAAGARMPDAVRQTTPDEGELLYTLTLRPGETQSFDFALAVESQGGVGAAVAQLRQALAQRAERLAERQAQYRAWLEQGVHFSSPDERLNRAFALARANMQLLEAESPALGRYFYAGLEMFPFWFSNDGAYSVDGMFIAGLGQTALNHIRIGGRYAQTGRVPHQVSPSGRLAFAGNAQETPLWVMSLWNAYCWTGDLGFLREMYPTALEGMFSYVLGAIDSDGDGYPDGPGMVEVEGMGAEKLDSAAYTWAALKALANMAQVLGDEPHARQAQDWAERISTQFDDDWWDADSGGYAMSLDEQNRRAAAPYWAIVTPLEVGLASAQHAAQTFALLRGQYLNGWGLQHTAGEERIWTLPTGTLSRAAYRYGEQAFGFEMLHHLADPLDAGSIGLFHELIPQGACIVQLWSAALLLRGVVADLLGVDVDAAQGRVRIAPQLPGGWDSALLENLTFGPYRLRIYFSRGAVMVENQSADGLLQVDYCSPHKTWFHTAIAAGEAARLGGADF